jgi:hypothetical protein
MQEYEVCVHLRFIYIVICLTYYPSLILQFEVGKRIFYEVELTKKMLEVSQGTPDLGMGNKWWAGRDWGGVFVGEPQ